MVGFETAGALHRFPPVRCGEVGRDGPVPVRAYVDTGRRHAQQLLAVRSRLDESEVTRIGDLAITTVDRTVADLLSHREWTDALDLYAWLTSRGLLDHENLQALTDTMRHRRGAAQLRRLLVHTANGAVSGAEYLAHDLFRRAGITGWHAGARVLGSDGRVVAVVDILFPAARLVVEIDGYRAHGDRAAFQQDRTRQNRLTALGYRVLRFTWADLTQRPADVVRAVRDLV